MKLMNLNAIIVISLLLQSQLVFSKDYDHQVVLDLGSGNSAVGLKSKRENKYGRNTGIINLKSLDPTQEEKGHFPEMSALTGNSRLYLVGHCGENLNEIFSDDHIEWTYVRFAKFIEDHAPQLKGSATPITISLVACNAGSGGQNSFAVKLSKTLAQKGIPAKIHARTGEVSRYDGQGPYKKEVNGKYHESGSKVIVETLKGNTTITPVIYPDDPNQCASTGPAETASSIVTQAISSEPATSIASALSAITAQPISATGTEQSAMETKLSPPSQPLAATVGEIESKAKAIDFFNSNPSAKVAIWKSASTSGSFGVWHRGDATPNLKSYDEMIQTIADQNPNRIKIKKIASKSEALSALDDLPDGSYVYWPSASTLGSFGVRRKGDAQPELDTPDQLRARFLKLTGP